MPEVLPEFLDLPPLIGAGGRVVLPGSKSISNRVLLLAALAEGQTEITGLLDSDDTRVMLAALQALGIAVQRDGSTARVQGGAGRFPAAQADLFMGNAGTAIRPLTAALALQGGDYRLHGVPRMHERPIGDLVDALRRFGCAIRYAGQEGYPPLHIGAGSFRLSGDVAVRGDVSSQFLTALLLALPLKASDHDIAITVQGELISRPYIEITLKLLRRFGVQVQRSGWERFVIPAGSRLRSPGRIAVEGDASSASYFLAAGVLGQLHGKGAPVRVQGVGRDSIQGDVAFARVLEDLGAQVRWGEDFIETDGLQAGLTALRGGDIDCLAIPDAAMTLAMTALFADAPTTLTAIGSWRVKETDRIHAMATELAKLGAQVESGADWLRVYPLPAAQWHSAAIATYDDHRMAMCFSLASFGNADIRILHPACVAKTYPGYFDDFARIARPVPVIAIDGPTASGKGSIASAVAEALGFHVLDSGVLYRLTAWVALQQGVPLDDGAALARLAAELPVTFAEDRIVLHGQVFDAAQLRTEAVGQAASTIAAVPSVRDALFALQRSFRRVPGLVADGRDMGTVVFPDAQLKVFLTASARSRAERRYKQLISQGIPAILSDVFAELEMRDARDAQRAVAALKPAMDAKLLDSTDLSLSQTVEAVLALWRQQA
ncbi:MAG: bifunctional 3-phosphoshikimate 1-carboxyvinyltransferase/cytidylate kinase [Thiomonas sp.]|uniref:bifunctional 3-phosphoshikimate 1-carboxyvinyltransferase/cytidylate kinase n=1 Tax=Thiomonas sp. TaxID=2047785 RepID=UPI002A35F8D4|nr:bifunctional 3-phosphoshikimate 1-carboxyvinyltransferase/cytidylate kinase [Thiomonas sp.]MDY0329136.1 bifunctional 3-phosphoshikimate 1-carboxyvinyltransferase/cytidylate kinase [Thiomonas sp.]